MKKIILINDGSTAAPGAAKLALQIAKCVYAEILIVPTYYQIKAHRARVLAGAGKQVEKDTEIVTDQLASLLQQLNKVHGHTAPVISVAEIPATDAGALADLARRADCWMVIRGCGTMPAGYSAIDFQSLLNRLQCPLLMVPESWAGDSIHRIMYLADLRYCRINIMRYLANWAMASQMDLSLAHFTKNGLVPIVESYGLQLFDELAQQLPGCPLTFNNIRERDIHRALDVLINGLHNDLLVLINHRFHFKEIIGERLTGQLPESITIPTLLFPI